MWGVILDNNTYKGRSLKAVALLGTVGPGAKTPEGPLLCTNSIFF